MRPDSVPDLGAITYLLTYLGLLVHMLFFARIFHSRECERWRSP